MVTECKRIRLYKRNEATATGQILGVRCGLWSCSYCAEVNKKRTIARAIHGAKGEKNWYLVTLTAHPDETDFMGSMRNLRRGWCKLYANMKKAQKEYNLGERMLYLKVWERHKNGRVHIHLLTNINWQSRVNRVKSKDKRKRTKVYNFVDEYKVQRKDHSIYYRSAWLADYAVKAGLGYINECRPLRGFGDQENFWGVIGYVSKYLGKQGNSHDDYPKGFHRVEFSQSWDQLPPPDNGEDEWHSINWELIFDDLAREFTVSDETQSGVIAIIWRWGLSRFGHDIKP